jgi:trimethylguanosine synthase
MINTLQIAHHIAFKCAQAIRTTSNDIQQTIIIDAFCGVGGNTIQFAKYFDRVIAIDISADRLQMARNNATVYNVADKIDFICGDFLQLLAELSAAINSDAPVAAGVFLSPPWGGPAYADSKFYDLHSIQPTDA